MSEPTAWVIVNSAGDMLTSTVAAKRVQSIKEMVGPEDGWRKRWRNWYRGYGSRCIRVRLVRGGGE